MDHTCEREMGTGEGEGGRKRSGKKPRDEPGLR